MASSIAIQKVMSNLINTFDPAVLDGKDYPALLLFFADLKRDAEQRGFSGFELAVNDDGVVDVLGFEQEATSIHPNTIAEIDRLLEPYL